MISMSLDDLLMEHHHHHARWWSLRRLLDRFYTDAWSLCACFKVCVCVCVCVCACFKVILIMGLMNSHWMVLELPQLFPEGCPCGTTLAGAVYKTLASGCY